MSIINMAGSKKNAVSVNNDCSIILNTTHHHFDGISKMISGRPTDPQQYRDDRYDMALYANRLRTYKGWPLTYLTPMEMARAGFYFSGKKDRVKCQFCSIYFDSWMREVNPWNEHMQISSECKYFTYSYAYNCAVYGPMDDISNSKSIGERCRFECLLFFIDVGENIERIHNLEYSSIYKRQKSYEFACKAKLQHDIYTLSEAGFMYSDAHNFSYTFCCHKRLRPSKNNDPWIEHAWLSPKCCYVTLMKGKLFVEDVLRKYKIREFNESVGQLESADDPEVDNCDEDNGNPDIEEQNIVKVEPPEDSNANLKSCTICTFPGELVTLIPCRHTVACRYCAITMESCPICREPYTMIIKSIEVSTDKKDQLTDDNQSPGNAAMPTCKICYKIPIETVFLPCKHAHACYACAVKTHWCPVCFQKFCIAVKIYLQ